MFRICNSRKLQTTRSKTIKEKEKTKKNKGSSRSTPDIYTSSDPDHPRRINLEAWINRPWNIHVIQWLGENLDDLRSTPYQREEIQEEQSTDRVKRGRSRMTVDCVSEVVPLITSNHANPSEARKKTFSWFWPCLLDTSCRHRSVPVTCALHREIRESGRRKATLGGSGLPCKVRGERRFGSWSLGVECIW